MCIYSCCVLIVYSYFWPRTCELPSNKGSPPFVSLLQPTQVNSTSGYRITASIGFA